MPRHQAQVHQKKDCLTFETTAGNDAKQPVVTQSAFTCMRDILASRYRLWLPLSRASPTKKRQHEGRAGFLHYVRWIRKMNGYLIVRRNKCSFYGYFPFQPTFIYYICLLGPNNCLVLQPHAATSELFAQIGNHIDHFCFVSSPKTLRRESGDAAVMICRLHSIMVQLLNTWESVTCV